MCREWRVPLPCPQDGIVDGLGAVPSSPPKRNKTASTDAYDDEYADADAYDDAVLGDMSLDVQDLLRHTAQAQGTGAALGGGRVAMRHGLRRWTASNVGCGQSTIWITDYQCEGDTARLVITVC